MEHNTRHRANLKGHATCICRFCATPGGDYRRTVKRTVKRAVRHSKAREILQALNDDNDHNGDADYMLHMMKLTLEDVRALRTVTDTFNYDDLP
jgi:hypothetical protein